MENNWCFVNSHYSARKSLATWKTYMNVSSKKSFYYKIGSLDPNQVTKMGRYFFGSLTRALKLRLESGLASLRSTISYSWIMKVSLELALVFFWQCKYINVRGFWAIFRHQYNIFTVLETNRVIKNTDSSVLAIKLW